MRTNVCFSFIIILLLELAFGFKAFANGAPLPQIMTQGNEFITKETKRRLRLRGVSLCSLSWHNPLQRLRELTDSVDGWKLNVIRLPVQVKEWERIDRGAFITSRLDPAVKICEEKGVYCIIDWHMIKPWDDDLADQRMRDFWSFVATRYADTPNIIYEIFNEPTKPKERTKENWIRWRDKAQTWVDFIRTMAPETVLLVGSPHWSQMNYFAADLPLEGKNIGYVTHAYPRWQPPKTWGKLFGEAANTIPMMITEWGWSSAETSKHSLFYGSVESFGQPLRDYLDEKPHIGWTAWSYDPRCGPAMLGPDKDMGEFVRQWLLDIHASESK